MLTKGLSINGKKYELLVNKLKRLLLEKGIKNINLSAWEDLVWLLDWRIEFTALL